MTDTDHIQTSTEINLKDEIDRQFRQLRGMLAVMSNNQNLCQIDSIYLTDAIWGVEDKLCEVHSLIHSHL